AQLELLRTQSPNFSVQSILQAAVAATQRPTSGQPPLSSAPSHSTADLFGLPPSLGATGPSLFGTDLAASGDLNSSAKRSPLSATSSSSTHAALNSGLANFNNLFDPKTFEFYTNRFAQLAGSNAPSLINAVNTTSPLTGLTNRNKVNSSPS